MEKSFKDEEQQNKVHKGLRDKVKIFLNILINFL